MCVRQDEEYHELQETIEHMNEMQGGVMVTMKRKQKMLGEVPELREKLCKDIQTLDERFSANEVGLQGKKQEMRMLLKERRKTNVEELRDTGAAESDFIRKAASGFQSSKAEVGLSKLSDVKGKGKTVWAR